MAASNSLCVLVIEDDADTRANLQDILALDGYHVETAASLSAALSRAEWRGIGAIILDRRLPDGNAEDALPRLRELAPEAAVLIVTAHGDLTSAMRAIHYGAIDYILKPVNPDQLRSALTRVSRLRQAEERARQSERLAVIGEMIAGLAHESRNALQRIAACAEMLELEVEDRPEARELVQRIYKAQEHLHKLFDEVRAYAAPVQLDLDRHNLSGIWREAWDLLEVQRQGREARLRESSECADLYCRVDRFRLTQVFRNVLENALAACEDPVQIEIACRETSLAGMPAVEISIHDNGPGIESEQRDQIFQPFFTTKSKGTGLGMSIAQRIVEAHGGRISVGSANPGAQILITLPR